MRDDGQGRRPGLSGENPDQAGAEHREGKDENQAAQQQASLDHRVHRPAVGLVRERDAIGAIGATLGASRWTVRGGGRIWLDGLVGTRMGRMVGVSAGPILGGLLATVAVGVTPFAGGLALVVLALALLPLAARGTMRGPARG